MDGLNHKIVRYKDGEEKALLEIIEQMTPLVKNTQIKYILWKKRMQNRNFT